MDDAAYREAAEEMRHPAEEGRPDGHSRQDAAEERRRHRPVDQSRLAVVPDDLVANDDVFSRLGDDDGQIDRTVGCDCAHAVPPMSPRQADGRLEFSSSAPATSLRPYLVKCPKAPTTAPKMARTPSGRRTDFQNFTSRGMWGSLGRPYHSGWSAWASTVTTPVPPTPAGS